MSVQVNGDFEALSPVTLTCPSSSGLFRLCCPLSSHRKIIFVSVCGSLCCCCSLASGNRTQTKQSSFWKCVKMNNFYLFTCQTFFQICLFFVLFKTHLGSLSLCEYFAYIQKLYRRQLKNSWATIQKYCSLP